MRPFARWTWPAFRARNRATPAARANRAWAHAFQVCSYAALREAYAHLVGKGIKILRATNHINERSFYFADPDRNALEIYYELPRALRLSFGGRATKTRHCSSVTLASRYPIGC